MTDDQRALLTHLSLWGSDGYPVRRSGRVWVWGPWRSIQGSPIVYKTKKAAVAAFEAYYDHLRELAGEEAKQKALALRRSGHPAYQNASRGKRRNGVRGAGVNARGGWRHIKGSGVWLARYATGPSYQIVKDGGLYLLEAGRWSVKADSFKGGVNSGAYRTLSEAQHEAANMRLRWRMGRQR